MDSNVASKALFRLNLIRDPMYSILIKDPANRSNVFLFNRTIGRKFCLVLHIHRNANVGRSWTRFYSKTTFRFDSVHGIVLSHASVSAGF